MTQAFNLAQLANNLNTSGQLDATDGLTGLVANSNLASSGTADSTTFLRGDRTWSALSAPIKQIKFAVRNSGNYDTTSGTYGSLQTLSITPSSSSNRILVISSFNNRITGGTRNNSNWRITRNGTNIWERTEFWQDQPGSSPYEHDWGSTWIQIDSPASTSALTYSWDVGVTNGRLIVISGSTQPAFFYLIEVEAS